MALKRVQKARDLIGSESFLWESAPRGFSYWMTVDINLFDVQLKLEDAIEAQDALDRKPIKIQEGPISFIVEEMNKRR